MKIKEFRIIQNRDGHPQLDIINKYDWYKNKIESYKDIVEIMKTYYKMHLLNEEYVYVLAFDSYLNLKGIFQLSHGTSKSSYLTNKELYTFLLLAGADKFVIVHNHPNGNLDISEGDYDVTNNIILFSNYMDIELSKHIIISKKGYIFID
jgi:DNA repair protein RadC